MGNGMSASRARMCGSAHTHDAPGIIIGPSDSELFQGFESTAAAHAFKGLRSHAGGEKRKTRGWDHRRFRVALQI